MIRALGWFLVLLVVGTLLIVTVASADWCDLITCETSRGQQICYYRCYGGGSGYNCVVTCDVDPSGQVRGPCRTTCH